MNFDPSVFLWAVNSNDVRFETVVAQGFFRHCFSPCPKIYFSFYTVFSHSSHGKTNLVVWVAFLVQNRKEKVWSHVIIKIFVSAPSYRDFPFFDPVMAMSITNVGINETTPSNILRNNYWCVIN